jgi:hypothetical protein
MADPEESDEPTVDGTTLKASYRIVAQCVECGQELKEATLDLEQDLADSIDADCEKGPSKTHNWSMDLTVENTERTEGRGRGMRVFYGVEVTGTITCNACGQEATVDMRDDTPAGQMDEVN